MPQRRSLSLGRRQVMVIAALALLAACSQGRPQATAPSDGAADRVRSPQEALLGRPAVAGDCFVRADDVVTLPDPRSLEYNVHAIAAQTGWIPPRGFPAGGRLPSRGFLGSGRQLAESLGGVIVNEDPESVWVLIQNEGRPRADHYFPIEALTGDRVWYRDISVAACI